MEEDRIICLTCGEEVQAQQSEWGTFFGYWCFKCNNDDIPIKVQHFDGVAWEDV